MRWLISQSVIPLARSAKDENSNDGDQLDSAGQAILKLLRKASDVAEANSRHAIETAQALSHNLRTAKDRIADLEAEVQFYREKSEHAEEWMQKIFKEIEQRLLREFRRAATALASFIIRGQAPMSDKIYVDGTKSAMLNNGGAFN